MSVYGPDIEKALSRYANEFDDIRTAERLPIIDLNAINPLSEFREEWQNTTTEQTEHVLETSANVDETAYLQSTERGQYVAGYEVQTGVGVRIDTTPSNDEVIRWGYYEVDENEDPLNGFYFGVDSTGIFVAFVREGVITRTYQNDWNNDTLLGDDDEPTNPSDAELVLSRGNIFQIDFTYYGYGPVKFSILMDETERDGTEQSRVITVHEQRFDGQTSIGNTNLPLRQEIDSGSTSSSAQKMYVGGRQFAIVGQYTSNNREGGHYRDSLTGVDDTQWVPAISIKIKDGTDIGSIDFSHILAELFNFEVSNGNTAMRWQMRRDVTLDQSIWENPSEFEGKQDETAIKVDTTATSIDVGGVPTGHFIDGGTLPEGGNQRRNIASQDTEGRITNGDTVTLCFKSQGGNGDVNSIMLLWEEAW